MSSSDLVGDAGRTASAAGGAARYDLRPLTTGEVLDRTFQLYRSRFALFAGLALLPAIVNTVTSALRLVLAAHQRGHSHAMGHAGTGIVSAGIVSAALIIVAGLIGLVLYGITQAATAWAVSRIYLGETASIKSAYKVGFQHWFRYTLVVLRQVWAGVWLPFVLFAGAIAIPIWAKRHGGGLTWLTVILVMLALVSLVYGVWAYLRLSLSVPASVVESLEVRAAVRRSAALLASRKVRVFLLFLLVFVLSMVIGAVESPMMIFAARARGTEAFVTRAIGLGVSFVAGTLIGPVGAIGVCLFYFDERVRREGFDIEWMMGKLAPPEAGAPELPAQPSSPEPV